MPMPAEAGACARPSDADAPGRPPLRQPILASEECTGVSRNVWRSWKRS
ncbi:MAG: hypothetical protein HSCHL_2160 [Hydrogenibacillus schlegelii]|uniref:Uncharacterized protein n=1 Tax=Hydrogenibacillus schlegelii TaxID=1484 RepID=A0A2T5G9W0_HYDSH|nr:MAG: hypothetical protein HSCHL_2160 [Hydrogenibacillus schlegelii]